MTCRRGDGGVERERCAGRGVRQLPRRHLPVPRQEGPRAGLRPLQPRAGGLLQLKCVVLCCTRVLCCVALQNISLAESAELVNVFIIHVSGLNLLGSLRTFCGMSWQLGDE